MLYLEPIFPKKENMALVPLKGAHLRSCHPEVEDATAGDMKKTSALGRAEVEE